MKQSKNDFYLIVAFIVIIIAFVSFFYESEFFPDKLGDMELKIHREGDVAVREIKGSHSAKDNVNPEEAHVARYRNSEGNRATLSVTLAKTDQQAVEKVENMNRGMGGMFSEPEIMEMNGLPVYYTEGGGEYHYYYAKRELVVWVALNTPDKMYQLKLMDEAIKNIGGQI